MAFISRVPVAGDNGRIAGLTIRGRPSPVALRVLRGPHVTRHGVHHFAGSSARKVARAFDGCGPALRMSSAAGTRMRSVMTSIAAGVRPGQGLPAGPTISDCIAVPGTKVAQQGLKTSPERISGIFGISDEHPNAPSSYPVHSPRPQQRGPASAVVRSAARDPALRRM